MVGPTPLRSIDARGQKRYTPGHNAAVVELADTQDSKSCEGDLMRVRLPPAAEKLHLI